MPVPRLYLVAPTVLTDAALAAAADVLASYDVACLRIAPAATLESEIRRMVEPLRDLARSRGVDVVLADHFRLAQGLGLDGVHLTDGARSVREARKALGREAIVGAYARGSRHDGMTAAEIGADYVSFGPVAPTPLGDGTVAPPELFAWWAEMIETPVVAEGGVTPEAAGALGGAADFLALGDELWSHPAGPRAALDAILAAMPAR